jgi:hypothetical protein
MMPEEHNRYRYNRVHKPLSVKEEYNLLSKKEKKIVDELTVIIRKYKKNIGPLKMVECLRRALDTV